MRSRRRPQEVIPTSIDHPVSRRGLGRRRFALSLAWIIVACSTQACQSAHWIGMKLLFDETSIDTARVLHDVEYVDEAPHPTKHRLDFYLPEGNHWPTLIFIHGGGWIEGDKNLAAGGVEIYRNIGTYYASQGLGVAVVNYRLQPEFTWREQVQDVARAVDRVRRLAAERGGDGEAMFLAGHSAGGQLAAYTAVADWPATVAAAGLPICGVVAVSGAGYDLADQETYDLGADAAYYEARFATPAEPAADPPEDWQTEASVTSHLDPTDPPFLLFYGGSEYPSLQRQARLLHQRLKDAGASSQLEVVPRQGHRRIVLTLSQGKHAMTSQVLSFIHEQHESCRDRLG